MWYEAVDLVLSRLKEKNAPLHRIRGISGACQQHGSVFWSHGAETLLGSLNEASGLKAHLEGSLSYPYGPNWQDHSTQSQCDEFDDALGSKSRLAEVTGSAAHHVSLPEGRNEYTHFTLRGYLTLTFDFVAVHRSSDIAPAQKAP